MTDVRPKCRLSTAQMKRARRRDGGRASEGARVLFVTGRPLPLSPPFYFISSACVQIKSRPGFFAVPRASPPDSVDLHPSSAIPLLISPSAAPRSHWARGPITQGSIDIAVVHRPASGGLIFAFGGDEKKESRDRSLRERRKEAKDPPGEEKNKGRRSEKRKKKETTSNNPAV